MGRELKWFRFRLFIKEARLLAGVFAKGQWDLMFVRLSRNWQSSSEDMCEPREMIWRDQGFERGNPNA